MTVLSFSVRTLLLAALVTTVVHSNPIDLPSPSDTITPCATVKCTADTTCKVIDGKAQCVPIDGVKCGNTVCAAGLTCCNPSCGICTEPGMGCTGQICPSIPVETPSERQCGSTLCKPGQECCNPSCGICVEPGKGCTKQLCAPTGEQCGKTVCARGLVCCNSSCGICTPPGGACTQQFCTN
ncbi:hypothetical protein VTI74DRAFT_7806 [Chaetomium olivicolor]